VAQGHAGRQARLAAFASFLSPGGLHWHAPIDEAAANSTYTTSAAQLRNPAKSPFSARQALAPGSGYWCSTGNHQPDQIVTWQGALRKRRKASGFKVSWAYAPDEVRVRTTPDGMHWEDVVKWHHPENKVSFEEDMLFDRPRNVMNVKVDMRGAKPWGYFGINQATLVM